MTIREGQPANDMPKKYVLEIYYPDKDGYTIVCSIESDDVIMPIGRGDFINPGALNMFCKDNLEMEFKKSPGEVVLKVTGVEHSLMQRENGSISQHKITVYTEPVENNPAKLYGKM